MVRSLKDFGCRWSERRQYELLLGGCDQLETMIVYHHRGYSMRMFVIECSILSRLPRLEEVQYRASLEQGVLEKSTTDVLVRMVESSTQIGSYLAELG